MEAGGCGPTRRTDEEEPVHRRADCGCAEGVRSGARHGGELCRKHGISQQTLYRWKAKYGGLEVSDAQRLRQLEEENRKLKQLVAEQALDIAGFKAVLSKKW
jgi:putative transposase